MTDLSALLGEARRLSHGLRQNRTPRAAALIDALIAALEQAKADTQPLEPTPDGKQ